MKVQTSVIPPTICLNETWSFATALQNMEVLADEETSGLTSTLTLDSGIDRYLVISAKTEKE